MNAELYLRALRTIVEADPGNNSEQSLAHEMALIAKQAIDATQPPLPEASGDVELRAREIINRHAEYMEGLDRGQRFFGAEAVKRMVCEALSRPETGGKEAPEFVLTNMTPDDIALIEKAAGYTGLLDGEWASEVLIRAAKEQIAMAGGKEAAGEGED